MITYETRIRTPDGTALGGPVPAVQWLLHGNMVIIEVSAYQFRPDTSDTAVTLSVINGELRVEYHGVNTTSVPLALGHSDAIKLATKMILMFVRLKENMR